MAISEFKFLSTQKTQEHVEERAERRIGEVMRRCVFYASEIRIAIVCKSESASARGREAGGRVSRYIHDISDDLASRYDHV